MAAQQFYTVTAHKPTAVITSISGMTFSMYFIFHTFFIVHPYVPFGVVVTLQYNRMIVFLLLYDLKKKNVLSTQTMNCLLKPFHAGKNCRSILLILKTDFYHQNILVTFTKKVKLSHSVIDLEKL